MNLVSVMVTGALMGIISPFVATMAIQPVIAQKRASNFSVAEASAVTYAALNEGAPATTPVPDGCGRLEYGGLSGQPGPDILPPAAGALHLRHPDPHAQHPHCGRF